MAFAWRADFCVGAVSDWYLVPLERVMLSVIAHRVFWGAWTTSTLSVEWFGLMTRTLSPLMCGAFPPSHSPALRGPSTEDPLVYISVCATCPPRARGAGSRASTPAGASVRFLAPLAILGPEPAQPMLLEKRKPLNRSATVFRAE